MRSPFPFWGLSTLFLSWAVSSAAAHPGPPEVWENRMLVHTVNVERSYARETVNVVVANTSPERQSTYYLPFPVDTFDKVTTLEVKDKNDLTARFVAEKQPRDERR